MVDEGSGMSTTLASRREGYMHWICEEASFDRLLSEIEETNCFFLAKDTSLEFQSRKTPSVHLSIPPLLLRKTMKAKCDLSVDPPPRKA
jgi:hypothetical protein